MYTSKHIVEWLEANITSGAKVYNDTLPATGRVILVSLTSGPGLRLERVEDNIGFALDCRGADRNYDDAEFIAWDADRAILQYGTQPHEFGDGAYQYYVGRLGGPPTQMLVGDTAGRYAFTCNYYATVATDL